MVLVENVVTFKEVSIFRTRLLPVSATYMFPDESTQRPTGPLNLADVPFALLSPGVLGDPARIVATPAGVNFVIVSWLAPP